VWLTVVWLVLWICGFGGSSDCWPGLRFGSGIFVEGSGICSI
jgi:hypothetical protein